MKKIHKIEFVSNIAFLPIAKSIKNQIKFEVQLLACDISQYFQRLTSVDSENKDVLIVHWNQDYFRNKNDILKDGRAFVELVEKFVSEENSPYVILNTLKTNVTGFVGLDNLKVMVAYHDLNMEIIKLAFKNRKIRIVDDVGVLANLENSSTSIKNELIMKIPYKKEAIEGIALEYAKIIEEIYLPRKKVLILDADNTLWGGILGEDGVDGVKIDEHNYPGSAYWRFQRELKNLKESGIVLGMVSKNNDVDVRELFDKVKMPLKLEDFTIRKVNWKDKATNIKEIANVLNLGVDSFVFVDDNIFEVEQVRHGINGISCYQFPATQPEDGVKLLTGENGLFVWRTTDEDAVKAKMYSEEVKRQEVKENASSLDEYLMKLELKLQYGINRSSQISRITQLINKTNQFNLTTKRFTENELAEFMKRGFVYDFRVIDKYGDMGVVGVVVVIDGNIEIFLMSCRALGREVESTMLEIVSKNQKNLKLTAEYIRSKKNSMVENFYDQNGFEIINDAGDKKTYKLKEYPRPKFRISTEKVM